MQLIRVDVGQPNVADLALVLQGDEGADRVLQRHRRVGAMQLIQVDLVQPEPPQAALTRLTQVLRPAVGIQPIGGWPYESTLGGDDQTVRIGM
jgi:hypothetical protein